VDWSKLPDIIAVGLLSLAFASVARSNNSRTSGLWLTGWLLIVLHFTSFLFLPASGLSGLIAELVGMASLIWAGLLFMWASVPYRHEQNSSLWMLVILLASNTLCIGVLVFGMAPWIGTLSAILLGAGPLVLALIYMRSFQHGLRWALVILYAALAVFLLITLSRPNAVELDLNAILFTVYFSCAIHFWHMYRRATAGAFITISGFLLWALVFVLGPIVEASFPNSHVESEVWNLPKFVVGFGMILLLLEDEIERTKHLALHDVLTGLPNRRLFQDRPAVTLERARRSGTQAALLVFDLDRFKQVNDTMGHHVGDLLLQRVATVFSGRVRRSDTVARTGGDEFSVILDIPTSGGEALHVGHALQDLLREPFLLEDRSVRTGASFGAAVFPDDAADMESLCIAADLRMYENKRNSQAAKGAAPGGNMARSAPDQPESQ